MEIINIVLGIILIPLLIFTGIVPVVYGLWLLFKWAVRKALKDDQLYW